MKAAAAAGAAAAAAVAAAVVLLVLYSPLHRGIVLAPGQRYCTRPCAAVAGPPLPLDSEQSALPYVPP